MNEKVDCRVFQDQLEALVNGDLGEEGAESLRGHALTCPDCSMLLKVHEHVSRLEKGTDIDINRSSIRGAMLTIQTIFYLPIVYSRSCTESVQMMQNIARQLEKNADVTPLRGGYRPRKLASRQLYVLQGLPGIGPRLAKRLLKRFGSVSKVLRAPVESLNTVEGIGLVTAEKIKEVLDASWCQALNLEKSVSDNQIIPPHQKVNPRITR